MKVPPRGSQNRTIMEALLDGRKLSSLDVIHEFGILRLPNRICDLRKKYGVKISQETKHSPQNRRVKWEEYWMDEKEREKWVNLLYSSSTP